MKTYRANRDGFVAGRRIRAGTVFELPEKFRPGRWMTLVEPGAKSEPVSKPVEPTTLSEMVRADGGASVENPQTLSEIARGVKRR